MLRHCCVPRTPSAPTTSSPSASLPFAALALLGAAPAADPEALLREGNEAFARGDFARAAALYEKAEVRATDPCPGLPEVFCDPLVTLKLAREVGHECELAEVLACDPYRRTWHRAQSIVGPDDQIADELEGCAAIALSRGELHAIVLEAL